MLKDRLINIYLDKGTAQILIFQSDQTWNPRTEILKKSNGCDTIASGEYKKTFLFADAWYHWN